MEFTQRTVSPILDAETTPAEQMANLIRRKRVQAENMEARLQSERKLYADIMTELALDIHRKRHFEYAASFRTLSAILERGGVRIRTYEGEELTDAMREDLNIVQWLPPEAEVADRVAEAFEPEVWVRGEMTHRAKLICREGRDLSGEPAEKAAAAEAPPAVQDAGSAPLPAETEVSPLQREAVPTSAAARATKPGPMSNKRKKKQQAKKAVHDSKNRKAEETRWKT